MIDTSIDYKFNGRIINSRHGSISLGIPSGEMIPVRAGDQIEIIEPFTKKMLVCPQDGYLNLLERKFFPLKSISQSDSKLVVIESPYAGNVEENIAYAKAAVRDSLARGEAPIASHLLFTQPNILDDNNPEQRKQGIAAGHAWISKASLVAVYVDKGVSNGMKQGIEVANKYGIPIEFRILK